MTVQRVLYRRSYDGMNRAIHKLRINIKNCPEEMQRHRENLTYRLEMLFCIREDMKKLIRQT